MLLCCFGLLEILPFVWMLSMPIYGSFCGTDVVLRLSVLTMTQLCFLAVIPRMLEPILPILQLVTFFVLLSLPVTLTPYFLIWLYDKVLWCSEPLWLSVEACSTVMLFMEISQWLVDRIDDNLAVPYYKTFILGIAGVCYAALPVICFRLSVYSNFYWLLACIVIVGVACHLAMWMAEDGVISDAALITTTSALVLYVMQEEKSLLANPLTPPDSWLEVTSNISFLKLLVSLANVSFNNTNKAVLFLKKLFSPVYLFMTGIRIYCVLSFSNSLWKYMKQSQENSEEEDTDIVQGYSSKLGKSPLILKLVFIVVYTQSVTYHIHSCAGDLNNSSALSFDQISGRLLQVTLLLFFYVYLLFKNAETEES